MPHRLLPPCIVEPSTRAVPAPDGWGTRTHGLTRDGPHTPHAHPLPPTSREHLLGQSSPEVGVTSAPGCSLDASVHQDPRTVRHVVPTSPQSHVPRGPALFLRLWGPRQPHRLLVSCAANYDSDAGAAPPTPCSPTGTRDGASSPSFGFGREDPCNLPGAPPVHPKGDLRSAWEVSGRSH